MKHARSITMMEKTGDISSQTPHLDEDGEKRGDDMGEKHTPTTDQEADKMEDGPMSRVSAAAADASKD
jgi:hypothetical protein